MEKILRKGYAMKERIQKILSARGVASRRHAEEMIRDGRVSCNGKICGLGDSADAETDKILVDGMPLPSAGDHVYIMLNKPRGFVTTLSDEKGRKNAAQLVADCGVRVYPVGRLDMDSDGLLLFTNDGEFANHMMHPKHLINKVYQVQVKGFTAEGLDRLKKPITLDGYRIQAPEVSVLKQSPDSCAQLQITIHEGRNRQVRRMCAAAGMAVKRLTRVAEGKVSLGDLKVGAWRYLTEDEVSLLRE